MVPFPQLYCVVFSSSQNTNTLSWAQAPNNPCGAFVCYEVFRSTSPFGPFSLDTTINSQTATTWIDRSIPLGVSKYYYYITDSFACPGASYHTSDTIENVTNPNVPPLVSFTVNPDSSITLNWLPSTSPQAKFYIIYAVAPNGNTTNLDTVHGRFSTTFTDSALNPYSSSVRFTIAADDSCSGDQPSSFNIYGLNTIFLKFSQAHCSPSIPLSWNAYSYLPGGLGGYQVWLSRNDSAYALIATLDSSTFSYSLTSFDDGDSLQIHVVAISANPADSAITASSQYLRFTAHVIKPPAYCYITHLTVDTSNNSVDLMWVVDNNTKLLEYETQNSQDGINYFPIPNSANGVQQISLPAPRFAMNADSTSTPQYYPYFYKVQAYDSCMTSTISPPGEIISLQGTLSDYYQITLNWNKFQLYGAHVLHYDLYRDLSDGNGMLFDQSFDSSTTVCIDSVFNRLADIGQFCYLIKATYVLNLPSAGYDSTLYSLSNIACVDHRPIIYIPNAFVYGGLNNFFKPRIIFGDPTNYSMSIFDRYGGKIFETHDPNGSWDGTNGGHPVDQGGYAYLIQFTALDGTPVERKGIVLCIRK